MKNSTLSLKIPALGLSIFALGLLSCKKSGTLGLGSKAQEAWNSENEPTRILPSNKNLERRFSKLKLRAEVSKDKKPWADYYWPNYRGGTALRWNSPTETDFRTYALNTKEQVAKMSLKERLTLSPAEKYDIFVGNWGYFLVNFERDPKNNPTEQKWWGMCDGIASMGVNFKEPRPIIAKSADGIEIPFGSSDIKALLARYATHFDGEKNADGKFERKRTLVGVACLAKIDSPEQAQNVQSLSECRDVNPGAFHLLLANYIGEWNRPIAGDLSNGEEIWNYPIFNYNTFILGERGPTPGKAAKGTVREISIQTDVGVKVSVDTPSLDNYNDSGRSSVGDFFQSYNYRLELNERDEIIGGEWTRNVIPDNLWVQEKPRKIQEYFVKLFELYEASLKSNPKMDLTKLP